MKMKSAQVVAKLVRGARQDAGLSQRALADAAGVSPTYVSHIETARKVPTLETLEALLRACQRELVITSKER